MKEFKKEIFIYLWLMITLISFSYIWFLKLDIKESKRYIGCLENRWKEYKNEIDCLEWKYERDKVIEDGDFDHRVSNRRRRRSDGYEYVNPYRTWKQVYAEREKNKIIEEHNNG